MVDEFSSLTAVSPIDGRYHSDTFSLSNYFSEFALIKYRVEVEVRFLIFFVTRVLKKKLSEAQEKKLHDIYLKFDLDDAQRVKEIESETKHDVKAVEYFLQEKLSLIKVGFTEYLHFGLTSEDTNSLALGLMLKHASEQLLFPQLSSLLTELTKSAVKYKAIPMLARTHGQPAVPTTVGKELIVYATALRNEFINLKKVQIEGKLSGAVGNFNALQLAYPKLNWLKLSDQFITSLGLKPNHFTTQILPADSYVKFFQSLEFINTIIIGFNQDMWRYISDEYFVQTVKEKEVGSSTMPQKVNPIHFENSEGNLGLANALLHHFITKLPISRLQRDLSDSTVKRNFGSALAYCLLAYKSCQRGLSRISPNKALLQIELLKHFEVVTEGVQTLLRTSGDSTAYEKLKAFSRGKKITQESLTNFINSLHIDSQTQNKLLSLTPLTYLGLAEQLVEAGAKDIYESEK